jgi:hypothetical protein
MLGPEDPASLYWQNGTNGLYAHSLIMNSTEEDLPKVESNLIKLPQDDLTAAIESINV